MDEPKAPMTIVQNPRHETFVRMDDSDHGHNWRKFGSVARYHWNDVTWYGEHSSDITVLFEGVVDGEPVTPTTDNARLRDEIDHAWLAIGGERKDATLVAAISRLRRDRDLAVERAEHFLALANRAQRVLAIIGTKIDLWRADDE